VHVCYRRFDDASTDYSSECRKFSEINPGQQPAPPATPGKRRPPEQACVAFAFARHVVTFAKTCIGRTVLHYTCRPCGAAFLSYRSGLGIYDKPPAHSTAGRFRFLVSVACHHHRAGLSPRPPFRCLQCLQVLPDPNPHGRVFFIVHSFLDFFTTGHAFDFRHDFRFVTLFAHRFAFRGLIACLCGSHVQSISSDCRTVYSIPKVFRQIVETIPGSNHMSACGSAGHNCKYNGAT